MSVCLINSFECILAGVFVFIMVMLISKFGNHRINMVLRLHIFSMQNLCIGIYVPTLNAYFRNHGVFYGILFIYRYGYECKNVCGLIRYFD